MDQEKITALVKLILSDPRLMELVSEPGKRDGSLTMIETRTGYDSLPFPWRCNVFCQELLEGGDGFLSCKQAAGEQWNQIRVYQPSLNFIAKLATGVADEPILELLQSRIAEGAGGIELVRLCCLSKIKAGSYRSLFEGHLNSLRSFGIQVDTGINASCGKQSDIGINTSLSNQPDTGGRKPGTNCPESDGSILWQYKALTEKDLLDVEKGTILKVGQKCIVTSLAADMAKRKSIQICREGEEI